MWGIVPAAGLGSRIQPLAFSKELLPVGSRIEGNTERPRAVSEYLLDRMLRAGVDKVCCVISSQKSDILAYYGYGFDRAQFTYVVQPEAAGLCDALFLARPLIAESEHVVIGLPDTIWYPEDGFCMLPDDCLSFLLFPVDHPELFDAVVTDAAGEVQEVQVKNTKALTSWVWGGIKMPGAVLHELFALWQERGQRDEYLGTLVNAYLARGGRAQGVHAGQAYVDVGTLNGYRQAITLLSQHAAGGENPAGDSKLDVKMNFHDHQSATQPAGPAGRPRF